MWRNHFISWKKTPLPGYFPMQGKFTTHTLLWSGAAAGVIEILKRHDKNFSRIHQHSSCCRERKTFAQEASGKSDARSDYLNATCAMRECLMKPDGIGTVQKHRGWGKTSAIELWDRWSLSPVGSELYERSLQSFQTGPNRRVRFGDEKWMKKLIIHVWIAPSPLLASSTRKRTSHSWDWKKTKTWRSTWKIEST